MANHAERQIPTARRAGTQPCVAIVDIVHGAHHDISRGAATFWYPQFLGGRVRAFGTAPPCETWSVARWIVYAQSLIPSRKSSPTKDGSATLGKNRPHS